MHPDSGIAVDCIGDIRFRKNSPDADDVDVDSLVDFSDSPKITSIHSVESMKHLHLDKHNNLIEKLKRMKEMRGVVNDDFCEEHQLMKTQYCKDDRVLVCLKCLIYGKHRSHSSLDLDIEDQRAEHEKIIAEESQKTCDEIVEHVKLVWSSKKDRIKSQFEQLEEKVNEALRGSCMKAGRLLEAAVSRKALEMAEVDLESFLKYLVSLEIMEGRVECDDNSLSIKLPQISFPLISAGFL